MRRAHLTLLVALFITSAACTESPKTGVRVRRVPSPPAYRVSDVVELSEMGRLLRISQEGAPTPDLRVVRHGPHFALVLRDATAEDARALAERFDAVAIETERRAGSRVSRWRTTRAVEGPVRIPTGTLVVSIDPVPPEVEAPADRRARWVQVSDTVAMWLDDDALEETDRCIPASSALSEHSLVPASFDSVVLWVALGDGRLAGVAHDPFAEETHVSVHATEVGCALSAGSVYTRSGAVADIAVSDGDVTLTSPDETTTAWHPQPGLNLSDREGGEETAR